MRWVKKEIEVKEPTSWDNSTTSLDVVIYLLKTVSQLDPKYEYLIGLASFAQSETLSEKQAKLIKDLYEYYTERDEK